MGGFWGRRAADGLMPLDDALGALGGDGVLGRQFAEVPLSQIVGTSARAGDFDAEFNLVNRHLRGRWQGVASVLDRGAEPPVDLVRLGELYFVVDGHHRVSVARARGWPVVPAQVVHICTIAYAMGCLRLAHLPSKAAERRFLDRVPLPNDVRANLWLDRPADWSRLADAAESWAFRRSLDGRPFTDREELAGVWWQEEVLPVITRLRDAGKCVDLRDVETYAVALATRDHHGWHAWPEDLPEHLGGKAKRPRRLT
ncbi:hypothetical protein [Amycolatopsis minnesotensis]|uniref:ParB-like nuclease family protein n=1 Tax=Amycolatopsis minnesotensis TaxID=337894 RepID=A0ABN2QFX3_9PSEU